MGEAHGQGIALQQQEGPRLRARHPGTVQPQGGARALEGPAARDQGQRPPLQRRPAVLQQALHRAGGRPCADAARAPGGVRARRPHAEARPRERGGVLHSRRQGLRDPRRRALRLVGGRRRDRPHELRAPALQRGPGEARPSARLEAQADGPVHEPDVPADRHSAPEGSDARGRGLRSAAFRGKLQSLKTGDRPRFSESFSERRKRGLSPLGKGADMAWGESKAWKRGGAHQKLYQSLLENAIAAPARNSKRRKILHPEDMPWEMSRQGLLKHLLNEQMNTRMETVDAYMQIIPPGSRSGRHRHLAEECLYVVEGRGYDLHQDCDVEITDTYHWKPQAEVKRWEWEAGDVIYIPPNTIHQHFNASAEKPVRLISAINRIYKYCGLNDLEQLEDAPEYDSKVVLTAELVEKYLKRKIKEPA